MHRTRLQEKGREALQAVLPILAIVFFLSFFVVPIPANVLMAFLIGGVLLVAGMMLFSLGAELAMEPMGERMGASITKTKRIGIVLPVSFLLGFLITISEPDLSVLANQVPSIPNRILILSVALGVGLFLALAFLRMLLRIPLRILLVLGYVAVFLIAAFAPEEFLAVAFDSGGVTTGPMTVPFIMAFGIGISAFRSDEHASEDSFGLIALSSVGPILAVLILSMVFRPEEATYSAALTPTVDDSVSLGRLFTAALPSYLQEMLLALLPIAAVFFLFQLLLLHLEKKTLVRITAGIAYTLIGLVLFLTGANVGFMPTSSYLGSALIRMGHPGLLIPIGVLIGFFLVRAEPAVYVLMKLVEEMTEGEVSGRSLKNALSIGVAVSAGLAMIRVLAGISIWAFLIPGYAIALVLSFLVPKMFTAIAFDSGGVASGPMATAFLLPLAVGACTALGGDVVRDAFGAVAMVAMTPLLTIQGLGLLYQIRQRKPGAVQEEAPLSDYVIIEL